MRNTTILGTMTLTCALLAAGCGSGSNDEPRVGPAGDGGASGTVDSSTPGQGKDPRQPPRPADSAPLGETWSVATSGTEKGLSVIIWADDRFIAVGDGGTVLASPDGVAWSALDSGISDDLRSLTWTGKQLVAVSAEGKLLTSERGTSWTEQGTNLNKRMRQVAWTGKLLSAVGLEGQTAKSSDGITWTSREVMDLYTFVPTSAVWIGDALIWGGYSDLTEVTFNAGMAFATKDGVLFTSLSPSYSCNSIFSLAWNGEDAISGLETEYNGKLIAGGRNGEMFNMTYGTWRSGRWAEGADAIRDVHAVIWTGVEAVAAGTGGLVMRSTTGHYGSWTRANIPKGASFTSLAWKADRLVVVGSEGTILTSP